MARPVSPRSRRNASNRYVTPVFPPRHPPDLGGNSPPPDSNNVLPPSPIYHDEEPEAPETTGNVRWTAQELWSLTLAVHDKQPYTAKHTEKAGRWDEVRDILHENGYCGRSSASYMAQMKRLLSWQRGSKVLQFYY